MVQDLMDRKEIKFSESIDASTNVITGTMYSGSPSSIGPKSITIFHDNETVKDKMSKVPTPVFVVEVPRPFLYESEKAIPWDYHCNYTYRTVAIDLTGVRGITRSRCCYTSDMAEKVAPEKLLVLVNEE